MLAPTEPVHLHWREVPSLFATSVGHDPMLAHLPDWERPRYTANRHPANDWSPLGIPRSPLLWTGAFPLFLRFRQLV